MVSKGNLWISTGTASCGYTAKWWLAHKNSLTALCCHIKAYWYQIYTSPSQSFSLKIKHWSCQAIDVSLVLNRWQWPCVLGCGIVTSVCHPRPPQSRDLCYPKYYQITSECIVFKWSDLAEINLASTELPMCWKPIIQDQCVALFFTCGQAACLSCFWWQWHCSLGSGSASWSYSFRRFVLIYLFIKSLPFQKCGRSILTCIVAAGARISWVNNKWAKQQIGKSW